MLPTDCKCKPEGITNNGSCSQKNATIGQCECKQNVTGRRCDRCEDAYYGYTNPPIGNCIGKQHYIIMKFCTIRQHCLAALQQVCWC